MEYTRLGRTGLSVSRTSFGALPIQRIPESESTAILRAAYEAGINFYDTANAYTDSEFKLGQALGDVRRNIIIATKTAPAAPEVMQQHLEQSLKMLRTEYIDIYQLHCAPRVYRPGGMLLSSVLLRGHPPYFCHRPPHRRRGGSPGKRSLRYPAISLLGHCR